METKTLIKAFTILSIGALLSGCVTTGDTNEMVTADKCVPAGPVQYQDLAPLYEKYRPDLMETYLRLRTVIGENAGFINTTKGNSASYCVAIVRMPSKKLEDIQLATAFRSKIVYNTINTKFNERAVENINKLGVPAIRELMRSNPAKDSRISEIGLKIFWTARNFADSRYAGGDSEGVAIIIPKESVTDYLKNNTTSQDMLNKSTILGFQAGVDLGRISVDMRQGL